jgi:biopolymer transport protein TolR
LGPSFGAARVAEAGRDHSFAERFDSAGRADSHTARLSGLQSSLGAGYRRSPMGMSVGESKGGTMAEMNVVPLNDILLVLLIIFMVITPLTPKGLDTLVPQPNPNQQQNQDLENKTVVVQVLKDGKVKINNEDATWDGLGPRIEQIFKDRAEKIAFVKGDNDVLFADVARAIDVMRGSGIDKVGLITAKLEAGQ